MKRGETVLNWPRRVVACRVMAEAMLHHNIELIDVGVGAAHFHVLARFTPLGARPREGLGVPELRKPGLDDFEKLKRVARHYVGICKKRSARALVLAGLAAPGGVWAVRGVLKPVKDRGHQLQVVQYIRDHCRKEGAAIWSMIREQGEGDSL
jgi:hypothetical protein